MKIVKIGFQWLVVLIMLALFVRGAIYVFKPADINRPMAKELIAVVDFTGFILESDSLSRTFNELEKDKQIKGYILRVNSGGGLVTPSQEMYEYLLSLKKPLYVSMGSSAASGGYMISLPGNKIYAMPSTVTGSIGVIMQVVNYEGLYEKIGLSQTVIKSGQFKDTGNPTRPMTDEDKEVLSAVVMDMYDQFVQAVALRRNMNIDDAKTLADGRIYTGRMAKEYGLVDEIGSWHDAYIDMKKDLNLPDAQYYIYEPERTMFQRFFSRFDGVFSSVVPAKPAGFYYLSDY